MNRTLAAIALCTATLVGCTDELRASVVVPELLVPDEVEVAWDAQFDDAEGVGALIPIDLMVYDVTTGDPLSTMGLHVEFTDDVGFLQILPAGDVENVDSSCIDCYWDAGRDRYLAFDATDALELDVSTDEEGLARVYFWVEALPVSVEISVSAPQFEPAPRQTFELHAAQ